MNKKVLLSALLSAGLLSSVANTFAVMDDIEKNFKWVKDNPGIFVKYPPLLFLAASTYLLFYNEPTPDAKQHGKWKNLLNAKMLVKDPKKYGKNRRYYV